MYNNTLVKKYPTIDNSSSVSTNITFKTLEKLPSFEISSGDVVKIMKSLDANKAHEGNEVSIRSKRIFFNFKTTGDSL